MSAAEADEVRRAFSRPNSELLIAMHRERFLDGARRNGVPEETARKIFSKINGHYMFPESHSHAFAITAYQVARLKRHHPLEFFVALINNLPMGFYPVETLKQDARRFGVRFLNPCVNGSLATCSPESGSVRLGLQLVRDVGAESAKLILEERERHGSYVTAGDLVRRTGLKPQAVLSLNAAGAFDAITPNLREALWEAGLHARPLRNGQAALPMSSEGGVPRLPDFTEREKMMEEYRMMGIYPRGHLMEFVRPGLGPNVFSTTDVERRGDDELVKVAGWPVARQHPRGRDGTVFVTIEDETGDVQVVVWHDLFARRRTELRSQVVEVTGRVSRWDGTTNVIATDLRAVRSGVAMPPSHDWR